MTTRPTFALAAGALLLCSAVRAAPGGDGWTDDFDAAVAQAKKEGKDLLVDFTGSDWCGWCIRLHQEVFSQEHFKTEAGKLFVFVELDFPRKKELAPETKKQNDGLLAKYGVQGFPTILLMDAEGRPYAQTGYQEGGAEKYVEHLNELRNNKIARDKGLAEAVELKGVERAKKLVDALGNVPEGLVVPGYRSIIDEIILLDKDNAAGLKEKYETAVAMHELDTALNTSLASQDWDGAVAVIDAHIQKHQPTGEKLQELLARKVTPLAQKSDWDAVTAALDRIVEIDADSKAGLWAEQTKKKVAEIAAREKAEKAEKGDKPEQDKKKEDGDK